MSSVSLGTPPTVQTSHFGMTPPWTDKMAALPFAKLLNSPAYISSTTVNCEQPKPSAVSPMVKTETPPTIAVGNSMPVLSAKACPLLEAVEIMEKYNQLTFQEIRLVQSLR